MTTVFFDIDTQVDFIHPAGALYVPGAERIVPALEKLTRFAGVNSIPVVSTTDAHDENDPEFLTWPPHCVAETLGQHKLTRTLLGKRTVVPLAPGGRSDEDAQQIILQKKSLNCFDNPNLDGLLRRLGAERYVVYGV
ncbi:MAG: cysteine hydrolase, partial [bacterium]|nr:cysteine hydrolase [bacterium]